MTLHLRELRLTGYRGFANASLALEDITVLVGPNGAGKSSLLDATQFLRQSVTDSLPIALERRGGFENLRHRSSSGTPQGPIRLAITFELHTHSDPGPMDAERAYLPHGYGHLAIRGDDSRVRETYQGVYGFELSPDATGQVYEVSIETFATDSPWHAGFRRDGSVFAATIPFPAPALDPQRLLLPLLAGQDAAWSLAIAALSRLQLCAPSVSAILQGTPIAVGIALEPDGRNLANVVHDLTRDAAGAAWILRHLQGIVPGIVGVRTMTHHGRRSLEFDQQTGDGPIASYPVEAMSQGTLRSLAILAALKQPVLPYLLGIDELEDSIHPAALAVLVDGIEATASGIDREADFAEQVVFTTHSPEVLSHPAVTAERLRMIECHDGRSTIHRIAPGLVPLLSPSGGLGRLMRTNGLQAAEEPDVPPDDFFALPVR